MMRVPTAIMASRDTGWMIVSICTSWLPTWPTNADFNLVNNRKGWRKDANRGEGKRVNVWLGGRDSNPDTMVQSHVSYRWTTSQYQPTRAAR